jgi:FkbM family methyltransferase
LKVDARIESMRERLRYLYRVYRYRYRSERAEIRFMSERLRPGDTAVDVGCFKGAYTYWMRRAVGASGSVVAFEPQPRQVEYLRGIVAGMKWRNVTIEGQGVADGPGQLELCVPESGHEASFVQSSRHTPCAATEPVARALSEKFLVPVTTLDAYFAGRPQQPRFIKIDVEGFESAVIDGARETLSSARPTLLVECETRHRADGNVQTLFDSLTALGYEGSFFLAGERRPLAEFEPERHQRLNPDGSLPAGYANNFAFEHLAR